MAYHTRATLLFHCVFSTKNRLPSIAEDVQPRLWAYMGGIARANGMKALAVGGMTDHVHLLLSLPVTLLVPKAIQLVKSGSSKWMHEKVRVKTFAWQEGYGAFTIGISQVPETTRYILNQKKHHAKMRFEDEWKIFLERHGLELEDFSRP